MDEYQRGWQPRYGEGDGHSFCTLLSLVYLYVHVETNIYVYAYYIRAHYARMLSLSRGGSVFIWARTTNRAGVDLHTDIYSLIIVSLPGHCCACLYVCVQYRVYARAHTCLERALWNIHYSCYTASSSSIVSSFTATLTFQFVFHCLFTATPRTCLF